MDEKKDRLDELEDRIEGLEADLERLESKLTGIIEDNCRKVLEEIATLRIQFRHSQSYSHIRY